jgi:general secretion pathway protein I
MHGPADRSPQRGFTLLEVLIAFAITALALGVLVHGSVEALRASATARDYQAALVRARSRLAAIESGGLATGERGGDDGGGFRWHTSVTQLAVTRDRRTDLTSPSVAGAARPALFAVSVVVSWGDAKPERSVRLDSERLGFASLVRAGP